LSSTGIVLALILSISSIGFYHILKYNKGMKDLLKSLLSVSITVGLSDRESFVKGVTDIMQEYQDDPHKAEKWSKAIVDYLEQVKDNINTQQSIKNAVSDIGVADKKDMTELTEAVRELTTELRRLKEKG
jgi:polyhydroxyalkanoate synthesis regulator phasin